VSKDWTGLLNTGNPFAFFIKVDSGMIKVRRGSENQRDWIAEEGSF
jgi:hypothetical protein